MKTIANVLGVARSHLHERVHRPTAARGSYCKAADEELLPLGWSMNGPPTAICASPRW